MECTLSAVQRRLIDLGVISIIKLCGDATDCHTFNIDRSKLKALCADVTMPSDDWTFSQYIIRNEGTPFTVIMSLKNPGYYVK